MGSGVGVGDLGSGVGFKGLGKLGFRKVRVQGWLVVWFILTWLFG